MIFSEFRVLLTYLRQYFEYWVMFTELDSSHDRRLNRQEFGRALVEIKKWGATVSNPDAAFAEMADGGE